MKLISLDSALSAEPSNSSFQIQSNLMRGTKTPIIYTRYDIPSSQINQGNISLKKPNIRIRPNSTKKLKNENNMIVSKIDDVKSVITPQPKRKSPDKKGKIREKILFDMMETKLDGWISDNKVFDLVDGINFMNLIFFSHSLAYEYKFSRKNAIGKQNFY